MADCKPFIEAVAREAETGVGEREEISSNTAESETRVGNEGVVTGGRGPKGKFWQEKKEPKGGSKQANVKQDRNRSRTRSAVHEKNDSPAENAQAQRQTQAKGAAGVSLGRREERVVCSVCVRASPRGCVAVEKGEGETRRGVKSGDGARRTQLKAGTTSTDLY